MSSSQASAKQGVTGGKASGAAGGDRVVILDTTLRAGEQSPGCAMNLDEKLQLYQVHAVTEGTDAQAEVTVRSEEAGKTVNGQGADHDTLAASARAYINALNKLLVKREKTAPQVMSAWHRSLNRRGVRGILVD